MNALDHEQMHREHRLWASEASMWHSDVAAWQSELALAESELPQLTAALAAHGQRLRQHAAAIRVDTLGADEHEHALAEYEQGAAGEMLMGLARQHRQEAERQTHDRRMHEQLKRCHHEVIVQWKLLLRALTTATHECE
jgi:hypothetical protein